MSVKYLYKGRFSESSYCEHKTGNTVIPSVYDKHCLVETVSPLISTRLTPRGGGENEHDNKHTPLVVCSGQRKGSGRKTH